MMINMTRGLSFSVFLSIFLVGSILGGDGKGGYAGAFYQVPVGARPTAMGGAYLAVSDDGAAPLFNPAGIANIKRPLFGSSFRSMQLDRKLAYVTIVAPVQGQAALGFHWLHAGSGSVEARDSDGDPLGRSISNNNNQFTIIFAKRFEKLFSVGANLSFIHSRMPEISASSVGFDLGAMFYIDQLFSRNRRSTLRITDMQVGLLVRHVAASFNWNSEDYDKKFRTGSQLGVQQTDKVPKEFGLGLSARFLKRSLLIATDFKADEKSNTSFNAGAEYYLNQQFALRSGFSDGRLTAGSGYQFNLSGKQLLIDYAFSTDKADEGSEHIFSIDVLF